MRGRGLSAPSPGASREAGSREAGANGGGASRTLHVKRSPLGAWQSVTLSPSCVTKRHGGNAPECFT